TWGHFYPPASAVALVPATLFPYPIAREVWFVLSIATLLYGLWRFMEVFVPHWDASVRALVLGLALSASSVRWGVGLAQPTAIVVGLFASFIASLKSGRPWVSFACAAFAGSLKVTFAIPFLLLSLSQRRFRLIALLLGCWALLNVIGIYGMGGPRILDDYRANMADFERPDKMNYPDPRNPRSMARSDWPYLLNAIQPDLPRNKRIGYGLSALSLLWLGMEAWRGRKHFTGDAPLLTLSAAAAAFSMLAVYHHHYDISILLVPLIAMVGKKELRSLRAAWFFILPVGLYAVVYPEKTFARLLRGLLGDSAVLITGPLACVVSLVGFIASCVVLRTLLSSEQAAELHPEPIQD
ncbi:MAG TPA: glycosyltransferase family 87 protein, partial [Polyangiaceae bacterium]